MSATPVAGGDKQPTGPIGHFVGGGLGAAVVLFAGALGVYLATLSWVPFPGRSSQILLTHLGLGGIPNGLDLVWGGLVRLADRWAPLPLGAAMSVFSAVCGAACAGLITLLMNRVRYRGLWEASSERMQREVQARRLSGWVAGLYLAVCIPFWVGSTRSLPDTFHLLILLVATWMFSEYQRTGSLRVLGLLGLVYGAGMTVNPTLLLYLPVAGVLLVQEWLRKRVLGQRRPPVVFGLAWLAGLTMYPLQAWALMRWTAPHGETIGLARALGRILRDQVLSFTEIRFQAGFLAILFFAIVPWLLLFVMSRRSPWYYDLDHILVRYVFATGLVAILFNAPFAFWNFLGMNNLMLTPHLLLSACMGFMAGEFWILGGCDLPSDASWFRHLIRGLSRGLARLLPGILLLAGVRNLATTQARSSRDIEVAARDILERLDGRDILFTHGLLDDILQLTAREQQIPLHLINVQHMNSPIYLRQLANTFPDPSLREALRQGRLGDFMDALLLPDEGLRRAALLDRPEFFREFGHLVPDGLLYRLEPQAGPLDLRAHMALQQSLWIEMERMAARPVSPDNLARPYQDLVRAMTAKVANNLGVLQAEAGDEDGARETFRAARRIDPQNLSALLNLLEFARREGLPEADQLEAEWEAWQAQIDGSRWALAIRCGYVWKAREWVQRGLAWALSGAPSVPAAARRTHQTVDYETAERLHLLDLAYLQWGRSLREDSHYQSRLMRNERDTEALLALAQLALRRNQPAAADAYLAEAIAMGLSVHGVGFDQAMVTLVRGDREGAVGLLTSLMRTNPGDPRIWMAIVLLTDAHKATYQQAFRNLRDHQAGGLELHWALAWLHMARYEWDAAMVELEAAVQIDASSPLSWELMSIIGQVRENRRVLQTSRRALLSQNPQHPIQIIHDALEHARSREWALAETLLRDGLRRNRQPDLLNVLASILVRQGRDAEEARQLLDEALVRQPFNPLFRIARAELQYKAGDMDGAEQDLRHAFRAMPGSIRAKLFEIHIGLARGETDKARERIAALLSQWEDLSAEQRGQLEWLDRQAGRP